MSDPINDLKQELLAAAERQHPGTRTRRGRSRGRSRRKRLLLAAAMVPIVAVVALVFTAPWTNSPGLLERAHAALTPPEGMILHAAWVETRTSRDYGCTVTPGPNELWADLSTPHRYRIIERNWPSADAVDRRSMACGESMTTESGGTPNGSLRFVPPDTLTPFGPGRVGSGWDEVSNLREALAAGRAHHEGRTKLDGRVVERIRIDCLNPPCSGPRDYWYVDRETFLPVQFEWPNGMHFFERFGQLDFDVVGRYLTYEYLPRTEANLALTDIRAQHPNATGP